MKINLIELRRSWTRVQNCTVHQTNSLDAAVMLELLDRIDAFGRLTKDWAAYVDEFGPMSFNQCYDDVQAVLNGSYPDDDDDD